MDHLTYQMQLMMFISTFHNMWVYQSSTTQVLESHRVFEFLQFLKEYLHTASHARQNKFKGANIATCIFIKY